MTDDSPPPPGDGADHDADTPDTDTGSSPDADTGSSPDADTGSAADREGREALDGREDSGTGDGRRGSGHAVPDGRDLAALEWRLVGEERRPGPVTMAVEEVAARTAAERGLGTVRVYSWPDVLSLGYRQSLDTVDRSFCADAGIDVTRRQTGGGGIYHDAGAELSYAVVAPADALPGDTMETYRLLCRPLFEFFERLGVPAGFAERELDAVHQPACYLRAVHPAHDVLAGGRKVSGNAQYRQRDAVVQHGSIRLFTREAAVERHLGAFGRPVEPARFHDRVTAVDEFADVTREEAVEALTGALGSFVGAERRGWTDRELADARELADRKYGTEAWTRDRTDPTG